MSFPDSVFCHLPELRGCLTPLSDTRVRLTYARYLEYDEMARAEGWEPGWRMAHEARERDRHRVLQGRMDRDLWVFGYGSLIWDPGIKIVEIRRARLDGWSRRFCMRISTGRGTREFPGLMAALDHGGACEGTVFRIAARDTRCESDFLWRREMFGGGYRPSFMPVQTPQGRIEDALVFAINPDSARYAPDLAADDIARTIAFAGGTLGPNFDYLDHLLCHLDRLGIHDAGMRTLHAECRALRQTAGARPAGDTTP